jgi:metal transporter CNNM
MHKKKWQRINTADLKHIIEDLNSKQNASLYDSNMLLLENEQAQLMLGALSIKKMTVETIIKPFNSAFLVNIDDRITKESLKRITHSGYSRVPVYSETPSSICGILLIKSLIGLDLTMDLTYRSIKLRMPLIIGKDESLLSLLKQFMKGKSHFAIVVDDVKV